MTKISLTVDGAQVSDDVEPRMLLVQYLREKLGKTGTVIGCDTSNCGACTVHLDGRSVKSCNVLAVQADGCSLTTVEGLAKGTQNRRFALDAYRRLLTMYGDVDSSEIRAAIVNHRTERRDIDALVDNVLKFGDAAVRRHVMNGLRGTADARATSASEAATST